MKRIETRFFTDPGHGRLRVRNEWIDRLRIGDRVSRFSYQDDQYTYLEEDCDASLFEAMAKRLGYEVVVTGPVIYEEESRVRGMTRFIRL